MKIFGVILVLLCVLKAQDVANIREYAPIKNIVLEKNIVTMQKNKDSVLIGSDFGEVLELNEDRVKKLLKLPNITSFYTDSYAPKVYSLDRMENRILILSEGDYGGKNLYIFENEELYRLNVLEFPGIKKVAFIDKDRIFLGLASNEIILYDLKQGEVKYKKQLSEAPFSDFALDLQLKRYALACESGIVYYGDIESGSVIAELEGANKDNVYQVKMAHFGDSVRFITAGQDRKVGVYLLDLKTQKSEFYTINVEFLVYSVGLNENGSVGAYMQDEESNIRVFDIQSRDSLGVLKGHTSLLNNIIFLDSTRIISSEDGKNILIWEK
ncbi:nitrate reductase [Helicobacter turcicus]|uniref:Nitrate reductase n=1 Tax=Helicobacter turcicus TaxID=2867412 RepID=A0ABS7JNI7_9HELI|nr:nitrate reductase [Helicobacter turcicus]MBX7490943.1 nitrate reductase [Helicobacter turcicus]MBX7545797.1 nitrate reductase [Helicobacter turcicus]